MNAHFLALAALFDFTLLSSMTSIIIPVVGIVFGCSIAIFAMYFHHQKARLLHDTARLALEKGQPIPPELIAQLGCDEEKGGGNQPQGDIRAGLVLIGVGLGLYFFFSAMGSEKMILVGAIPGFIGVALLLFGVLSAAFSGRKSRQDAVPRS